MITLTRHSLKICTIASILLIGLSHQQQGRGDGSTGIFDPHLKLEQNVYLDFPVTKKDFNNWESVGAAVMLKNRTVLAPETRDKKGILYSKHANPFQNAWMLDLEINIGNDRRTSRGGTGLGIFYLKNIDQVSHKESIFGYSNRFEGLGVYLNSILKSESRGANKEINNAIQGFWNDGSRAINVFSEKQHICYKHYRNLPPEQNLHLRLQYDSPLLTVSVYDVYQQQFDFCFSFEAKLDFPGYFLFSGSSGVHNPDHVYIHSAKLYDPKTVATNDHFQESRRAKAEHEYQLKDQLNKGVRDLFEKHSLADSQMNSSQEAKRDSSKFFQLIPHQHNQLQHRLNQLIERHEEGNNLFFETMKGLPSLTGYQQLKEKLFNFRLSIDNLNIAIEKENSLLRTYEKSIKQVKYTANIQRGLQQRDVINPQTKKLLGDLQSIDNTIQQISLQFKDYQQAIDSLGVKIRQEAGFTSKLEEQRRKFAKEQSQHLDYDMAEIDDIFNEMELHSVNNWFGISTLLVNIGMILVIIVSIGLWLKMNKYEGKNA